MERLGKHPLGGAGLDPHRTRPSGQTCPNGDPNPCRRDIKAMGERAIAAMERNWAEQVGCDRYQVFKEVLDELALG